MFIYLSMAGKEKEGSERGRQGKGRGRAGEDKVEGEGGEVKGRERKGRGKKNLRIILWKLHCIYLAVTESIISFDTEYRIQGTDYKKQITKYWILDTGYR